MAYRPLMASPDRRALLAGPMTMPDTRAEYTTVAKIALFGGPHKVGRGYREDRLFIVNRRNRITTLAEHGKDVVSSLRSADKLRF